MSQFSREKYYEYYDDEEEEEYEDYNEEEELDEELLNDDIPLTDEDLEMIRQICEAIEESNTDKINSVLKDAEDDVHRSILVSSPNTLDHLPSPINMAIIQNKVSILNLLLQYIPNNPRFSMGDDLQDGLDLAFTNGSIDIIKYFIDKKIYHIKGEVDDSGNTFLHKAAAGKIEALNYALSICKDVNAINNVTGETPIFSAILSKSPSNVKALIDAGAQIETLDNKKRTILHYISTITPYESSIELAEIILSHNKLNINQVDDEGYSAYDIASILGNNEFCAYLLERNAIPSTIHSSVFKVNPIHSRRLYHRGEYPESRTCVHTAVMNGSLFLAGGFVNENDREKTLYRCNISNIQSEPLFPLSDLVLKKSQKFEDDEEIAKCKVSYNSDGIVVTSSTFEEEEVESFIAKEGYVNGVTYFEASINSGSQNPKVAIGFIQCEYDYDHHSLPGWNEGSFGFSSEEGRILVGIESDDSQWKDIPIENGDTFGIGYNFKRQEIFYTKNGQFLGTVPYALGNEEDELRPYVGVASSNTTFTLNFGNVPFKYDFTAPTLHWEKLYTFSNPIIGIFSHPEKENTLIVISTNTNSYFLFNVNEKKQSIEYCEPLKEKIIPHSDNLCYLADNKIFILVRLSTVFEPPKTRTYPYLYCLDLKTNQWSELLSTKNFSKLSNILSKTQNDFSGFVKKDKFYIVQNEALVEINLNKPSLLSTIGTGPSKEIKMTESSDDRSLAFASSDFLYISPFIYDGSVNQWILPHIVGEIPTPRDGASLSYDPKNNRYFICYGHSSFYDTSIDHIEELQLDYKDLGEGLIESFNVKERSDFTVQTSSKEIFVSKAILASRSKFFNDLLKSNEAQSSYELKDTESTYVEAMLRYFYTDLIDYSLVGFDDHKKFLDFIKKYVSERDLSRIRSLITGHRIVSNSCFYDHIREAFNNKEYSDVKFVSEKDVSNPVHAHRAIIYGRNKALYELIQTGDDKITVIKGVDDIDIVKELVRQCYEGKYYSVPGFLEIEKLKSLILAFKKYNPSVVLKASMALCVKLTKETSDDILKFSESNGLEEVVSFVKNFNNTGN